MTIPIVIVDDDTVDRYTAKRQLARHGGFEVPAEYTSGDAFLEAIDAGQLATRSNPALVLMDIKMPGRNGFETLEALDARLQETDATSPFMVVFMLTSSANPRDRARVETIDIVQGYVEKPITKEGVEFIHDLYLSTIPGSAA
ncbi:MAG: hypothetical protein CML02_21990 [Pseudooceanicola sp.]|jgi:CheY-like chemotaxis protein|nr:hypothetical protein [Pseudooceanicola sp.]